MYTKEVMLTWIEAIEDLDMDALSDWEHEFVTSVKCQLQRKGYLTPAQQEKLESIYAKKTK